MKTKKVLSVLFASLFLVAAGFVSCSQEVGVSPVPSNRVTYCSIEFEGNGGTLSFTLTQVAIGQYLTEFPTAYKDGYELKGWYYNNNGVETKFDENTVVTDSLKVYAKWIIPYNPGVSVQTISLDNPVVTVESGTTFELTATYTPADAEVSPSYSNYYNYLYYPVGSITAAGGIMSKRFYAKLPGSYTSTYLYDGYTGKSTGYANVTVTGPALDAIPELPVSGSKAETASEYTHYTFSDDNYVTFYKLELTADVTYAIQTSGNSIYNRLYDSSYNSCYSASSSTTTTYTPSVSGTYILGICSYYLSGGTVGVNVYSPSVTQTLTLSPATYTVESGETFEITANYSPADAEVSPTYGNYSNSRYYPVGNMIAADGVMSKSFYAKLPGTYSSTYLKDNMSGKQTAYASVTVTGPALSDVATLAINSTKAENAEDFTKYTFSADNYVKFYKVNLSAGTTYNFQVAHNSNIISGSPFCYWALYNSSYSIIYGESSSSSYAYTPASDGTYILGICSYYNNSGTIGVNVYNVQPISDFTVSATVNMTIGDTISENIVTTPANGCETNFTVSSGNNDLFAKFVNNQVVFTCGFPGTKTITVKDNISGIQKTIAVNVAGDSSVVQEIDTIYGGASSNPDEYTKVNLSDTNPSQLLKVYFEAGKTYSVQCADSDNSQGTGLGVSDCYFYLYDTSFAQIRSQDNSTINYSCTTPGYYYVGIRRYSNNGNRLGAVHIFTPKLIESLVLNPSSYTVESGETFAITADYTPADAVVSANYSNYTNSRYYPVGNMTAANGVMSKSFYAKLPGTYTSTNLYDNTSGKSTASASVTVTGPAVSDFTMLSVGSKKAESETEFTKYTFSDNNYVTFYKVELEAGTTYNFQIAHNGNIISNSPYCYWALYDSSYERQSSETTNYSNTYTPTEDGTYILGISTYYNSTGTIGVSVYSPKKIQTLTLNPASYTVESGETFEITADYSPADAEVSPSCGNYSNSRYYPVGNTTAADGVMSKSFYAKLPGTYTSTYLKDNMSGKQTAYASVTVTGPALSDVATLSINSTKAENAEDFTQYTFSADNYVKFYKVNLAAGSTYNFQVAHNGNVISGSPYCYWALYDSSYVRVLGETDNSGRAYTPASDGTYILGICSDYNNSGTIGVSVYSPKNITSLTLDSIEYTGQSGSVITITGNYLPVDAETELIFANYNSDWYITVGNVSASNGVWSQDLYLKYPGRESISYIYDNITGKSTGSIEINTTGPDLLSMPELTVSTVSANSAADYTQYTFTSNNLVTFYKVSFEAGKTYQVEFKDNGDPLFPNSPYCYYRVYNEDFSSVLLDKGSYSTCITPSYDQTCIIGIVSYYSGTGTIGVNVYNVQPISDFTVSSTVNMTIGDTVTENIILTPSTGVETNFSISNSPSDLFAQVIDNQLTINCGFPGTKTITLTDSISGISKNITVNVAGDSSVVQEISVDSSSSSTASDYTQVNLSDTNPSQLLKVYFEAGKTYTIQCADSDTNQGTGLSLNDCYFYLYDSGFNFYTSQDSGTFSYNCTVDGYYYVGIRRYSNSSDRKGAVHVYTTD